MRQRAIYCLSKQIDIHSLDDSEEPTTPTALATTHRKKKSTTCCSKDKNPTRSTYLIGVHYENQTRNSVRTVSQIPPNSDLTVIDR